MDRRGGAGKALQTLSRLAARKRLTDETGRRKQNTNRECTHFTPCFAAAAALAASEAAARCATSWVALSSDAAARARSAANALAAFWLMFGFTGANVCRETGRVAGAQSGSG